VLVPGEIPGHRSETVRRANLGAIVRELHLRGPRSRSELGILTGLTRSAIRGLIGELVDAGLVDEVPSASTGMPGRPSPLVRPDPNGAVVLGVEVNVDSLAAARVGLGGAMHELVRVDRPRTQLSVEATVDDLATLAGPLADRLRHDPAFVGVGVGVAGIVRRSDGRVRHAPNLGWREVDIARRLADALDLSAPIAVGNEADLGGLAEHRRGSAARADTMLYITGEVGVGGNVVIDGQTLEGAAGYAGEVGHMPVNPAGSVCGCGATGCWETEIGERALLIRAGRDPEGGRAAVDAVIADAWAGDERARAATDHVGTWLGIGLAGLVNIFNPTVIVLGGLFERLHPFVARHVDRELATRSLAASRDNVTVLGASLGIDAPVIGAAELAFAPILADPATRLRLRAPEAASA
jgi:predicted NBD/HSP70 family sugar kinase